MNVAWSLFVVLMAAAGLSLKAQSVEVSLAPQSSPSGGVFKRGAFKWTLGAFRFAASGSSVDLNGFTLTITTFEMDGLHSTEGIQVWLDDGNEKWDSAPMDTQLAVVGGGPSASLTFAPITVTLGAPVDIWIRCSFTDSALDREYTLDLANPADVSLSAGSVVFGTPPPTITLAIRESDTKYREGNCVAFASPPSSAPISLIAGALVVLSSLAAKLRRRQNTAVSQPDVGEGRSKASACDTWPDLHDHELQA